MDRTPFLATLSMVFLLSACGTEEPRPQVETSTVPAAPSEEAPGTNGPTGGSGSSNSPRQSESSSTSTSSATLADGRVQGGKYGRLQGGDGSAKPQVAEALRLPEGWRPYPPGDLGPIEVACGTQLDPGRPRDAAQRRWTYDDALILTSEVHVHDGDRAARQLRELREKLRTCSSFDWGAEGEIVPAGEGEDRTTVERVEGAPAGWTVWTQRTPSFQRVEHFAVAETEDGFHVISLFDPVTQTGPEVLLDVLKQVSR